MSVHTYAQDGIKFVVEIMTHPEDEDKKLMIVTTTQIGSTSLVGGWSHRWVISNE